MNPEIQLHISLTIPTRPARLTDRVLETAAIFGLELHENARHTLATNLPVTLKPGELVLITGESGAGKSTLLRAIEERLREAKRVVVRLEEIELANDRALVDCFACGLEEAMGHLARAGLSDARLLLRTPAQLSEGQRFRYRLAQFFASASPILIADEFAATLDRTTAKVLAWQLQKFIRQSRATPHPRLALLATSHQDLTPDLQPHIHIQLYI